MPIYMTRVQIADHLAGRITGGEWPPGGRLPKTKELADAYGVSVGTMRWVLDRLAAQGVVMSRQGVGWFVAD